LNLAMITFKMIMNAISEITDIAYCFQLERQFSYYRKLVGLTIEA